jgi:hypothetical protein
MSGRARVATLVLVVVVVAGGFVLASSLGGDDDKEPAAVTTQAAPAPSAPTPDAAPTTTAAEPPKPTVKTVVVRNAKPVGGVQPISVKQGDTLRFAVQSDVADGIHVHGYDILEKVDAGGSVNFEFPAKIGGVFEVELEDRGVQIASLKVEP